MSHQSSEFVSQGALFTYLPLWFLHIPLVSLQNRRIILQDRRTNKYVERLVQTS